METRIDKSEVTQSLLNRMRYLDKHTMVCMIQILQSRINLPDSAYTKWGNEAWIRHVADALNEYLDIKDEHDKNMRAALANMQDAYENPEY
jgi:uncharacterized protein CbrC (UPF0167 family)